MKARREQSAAECVLPRTIRDTQGALQLAGPCTIEARASGTGAPGEWLAGAGWRISISEGLLPRRAISERSGLELWPCVKRPLQPDRTLWRLLSAFEQ